MDDFALLGMIIIVGQKSQQAIVFVHFLNLGGMVGRPVTAIIWSCRDLTHTSTAGGTGQGWFFTL